MIAMLLAAGLQAAPPPAPTPDGIPLAAIGKQALPAKGCAAFLWSKGLDNRLVAMATADPAQLRVALDGPVADFVRSGSGGSAGFGFPQTTEYQRGDAVVTLEMTVLPRDDMSAGATVPDAVLRIDRKGKDTLIVPVGGLIGCNGQ